MKYIITGASGLLGKEILRFSPGSIGISSLDCDLIKTARIIEEIAEKETIDAVIHCAARVGGVKANTERVAEFFDDNVKINLNVLDACRKSQLKLVSILSTCIYPDEKYVNYPLTEEQLHLGPAHTSNFGYAYSKRMLEVQSKAYKQQYGCNFINIIPNNLYGINDNYDLESGHVIPALIRKFYEAKLKNDKEISIWGSGRALREFTYAKDAARIILMLTEKHNDIEPINIGNCDSISIKDLALMISKIVGYSGEVKFDSTKLEGQYKKPSSNQKLLRLGNEVVYTSLIDGLSETVEYFMSSYPLLRGIK